MLAISKPQLIGQSTRLILVIGPLLLLQPQPFKDAIYNKQTPPQETISSTITTIKTMSATRTSTTTLRDPKAPSAHLQAYLDPETLLPIAPGDQRRVSQNPTPAFAVARAQMQNHSDGAPELITSDKPGGGQYIVMPPGSGSSMRAYVTLTGLPSALCEIDGLPIHRHTHTP